MGELIDEAELPSAQLIRFYIIYDTIMYFVVVTSVMTTITVIKQCKN